jgi:hypothetical protein
VIHQNNTHGASSTPYSWFQCKKPSWKKGMLNENILCFSEGCEWVYHDTG